MDGRRNSLTPEATAGLGAALAVVFVVSAIQFAGGSSASMVGWLAVAPFLAAAFAPWRFVVGIGLLAAITTLLVGILRGTPTASVAAAVAGMTIATAGAVAVAVVRQSQYSRYAELSRLAEIAREAVLRPIGPQVGPLAVAGRYISASAAADIGGDLYEALDTPYGVRMIIGDVRGKGLDAVRLASIVLGRLPARRLRDARSAVGRRRPGPGGGPLGRATRTSSPPPWSRSAAAR